MEKQLQKKIHAFIVAAMMLSVSMNVQIIYTDEIPEVFPGSDDWVKLGVTPDRYSVSITRMEYAFNDPANLPTLAGVTEEGPTGIFKKNVSSLKFYSNPSRGLIFLPNNYDMTLTDLTGKIITKEQNTNNIDISNQPAG